MNNDLKSIIKIRQELHQIPELSMKEYKTHKYIKNKLEKIGIFNITEFQPTGLIAIKYGTKAHKTIAFRADMDGLPIIEKTGLNFASKNGNMHACGHDAHMAILLHFAQWLKKIDTDLLNIMLIFQPGEEGSGGANIMINQGIFDILKPDEIYALHVNPDLEIGTIAVEKGEFFAATTEFHIKLHGKGGHAAYPYLYDDLILAGSELVQKINTIIAKKVNPFVSALVSIGKISIGTKNNIFPETGTIEGTIRAFDNTIINTIKKLVIKYSKAIEVQHDIIVETEFTSEYPVLKNDPVIVKKITDIIKKLNDIQIVDYGKKFTGEDFAFFLQKVPGLLFWLGVKNSKDNFPLHNAKFNLNEKGLLAGFKIWKNIIISQKVVPNKFT